MKSRWCQSVVVLVIVAMMAAAATADDKEPVKVFLLVGQSNMQGKGSADHLQQLVESQPEKYGHLMKDGEWIKRDDVLAAFHGVAATPLTIGTTTRPPGRVGPEIGFGKVVGDAFDEQVLLLKIAWGGQSLAIDFNPPSRGKWGDREFTYKDGEWWKPGSIGWAYQAVFNEMHIAIEKTKEAIPELADREFEIVGLVWFQGWNDQINGGFRAEYKENMVAFITDIRKHLGVENLPIVIGVVGHGGEENVHPASQELREAQTAAAEVEEFKGTVVAVPTAPFWDPEPHGDGGYHYNGSAKFFYNAGEAFGKAMLKLLENQKK